MIDPMAVGFPSSAVAVRPGEHACCRFADPDDRERVTVAFLADGLRRGHKVIYVRDRDDVDTFTAGLEQASALFAAALARRQLLILEAAENYTPDGAFDIDRMLAQLRAEYDQAIADRYTGLSRTGDMGWAMDGNVDLPRVAEYERRLSDAMEDANFVYLCQYDYARFGGGTLTDLAAAHDIDASPELAAIGRDGELAAARVNLAESLRLSGELDYGTAETVADVLDAHYHGELRLDLADLEYVDVAGLRALRGRKQQTLTITGASGQFRRLIALLAWDTDPDIRVLDA
jgi:anti-anti-sigma factor